MVWAPWALVATIAVACWVQTHTGHRWRVEGRDLPVHLLASAWLLWLGFALGPLPARWTGAGPWTQRSVAALAVLALLTAALAGLFGEQVQPQYLLGLLALAAAAALLSTRRGFEIFSLSAVALGLDALLLAGLARWLFRARGSHAGDPIVEMLLLGLAAAALLAPSVHRIMALARRAEAGA